MLELLVPVELQEKLEKSFSQKHLFFWLLSPRVLGHHFHVIMILAKKVFIPFNISSSKNNSLNVPFKALRLV